MTPKIIHQTWKSSIVPPEYIDYVSSVKKLHPDYTYYLHTDEDIDNIVKNYTPQFYDAYKNFSTHINRVDFVRYVILYYIGGIYLDMDVMCLKNFDDLVKKDTIILAPECEEHRKMYMRNKDILCNAVMISPPNNQFWYDFMVYIITNYSKCIPNPIFQTGPMALTNFWDKYAFHRNHIYNVLILSPHAFYPQSDNFNNHTVNGVKSITSDCKDFTNTYAIHMWSHSWLDSKSKWVLSNRRTIKYVIIFVILVVVLFMLRVGHLKYNYGK